MKRIVLLALVVLLSVPAGALAYNVKLKDGSIIFARSKYEVRGKKAIITLQNGTVTQIDLDTIDIPGTEQYNKENPGNVIAIAEPGGQKEPVPVVTPKPTTSLQDIIRQRNVRIEPPASKSTARTDATGESGPSWQPVDQTLDLTFRKVLDGAGITQYRLANYRGKVRLLATANTEEAVFNILGASARVLADLGNKGREISVEIVLTSSSGESGGSFEMTSEQGRLIINGNLSVADYFIKNVIL